MQRSCGGNSRTAPAASSPPPGLRSSTTFPSRPQTPPEPSRHGRDRLPPAGERELRQPLYRRKTQLPHRLHPVRPPAGARLQSETDSGRRPENRRWTSSEKRGVKSATFRQRPTLHRAPASTASRRLDGLLLSGAALLEETCRSIVEQLGIPVVVFQSAHNGICRPRR